MVIRQGESPPLILSDFPGFAQNILAIAIIDKLRYRYHLITIERVSYTPGLHGCEILLVKQVNVCMNFLE